MSTKYSALRALTVTRTFCVPRDGNIQRYFCAVYNYVRKADLSKRYWDPKRKLGVATHKLQFEKKNVIH